MLTCFERSRWIQILPLAALSFASSSVTGEAISPKPRPLRVSKNRDFRVTSVAWAPDGKILALAVGKPQTQFFQQVQLWNADTATLRFTLPLDYAARLLTFSPDGALLAGDVFKYGVSAGIHLWDTHSGKRLHTLEAKAESREQLVFLDGGRQLRSGGINVWYGRGEPGITTFNLHTGKMLKSLNVSPPPRRFFWGYNPAPSGSIEPAWTLSHNGKWGAVALLQKDKKPPHYIVDNGGVLIFDARSGKRIFTLAPPRESQRVQGLSFSPDASTLAVSVRGRGHGNKETGVVQLWSAPVAGAKPRLRFTWHTPSVADLTFSLNGSLLATRSFADGVVRLRDARTGKLRLKARSSARSLEFSPDNRLLALSYNKVLLLWDTRTGRLARQMTGHRSAITDLAFSPDGSTLASADEHGTVNLWRLATAASP